MDKPSLIKIVQKAESSSPFNYFSEVVKKTNFRGLSVNVKKLLKNLRKQRFLFHELPLDTDERFEVKHLDLDCCEFVHQSKKEKAQIATVLQPNSSRKKTTLKKAVSEKKAHAESLFFLQEMMRSPSTSKMDLNNMNSANKHVNFGNHQANSANNQANNQVSNQQGGESNSAFPDEDDLNGPSFQAYSNWKDEKPKKYFKVRKTGTYTECTVTVLGSNMTGTEQQLTGAEQQIINLETNVEPTSKVVGNLMTIHE